MQDDVGRLLDDLLARAGRATPLSGDAIVIDRLSKTYADGTEAVRDVTLRVRAGESYGLLGPNGAQSWRRSR
jgi:ATPase subunit of ABC transporter with duplicated ATPase domains